MSEWQKSLHPLVKKWIDLQWMNAQNTSLNSERTGDSIAGRPFRVVARLGSGSEGTVYLVETRGGLKVLKIFDRLVDLQSNTRRLMGRNTLRAPQVEAVEMDTKRLLLEYLEGLPLDFLKTTGAYERIGMSKADRDQILNEWKRLSETDPELRQALALDHALGLNVIWSFRDREFQMIDPH